MSMNRFFVMEQFLAEPSERDLEQLREFLIERQLVDLARKRGILPYEENNES